MKKLFVIISFVLMAAISQAQAVKGVVMKDGINAGGKNVSNAEIQVLDSAKVGVPIQRQIDKKIGTGSIVAYSETIYNKTEVDAKFSQTLLRDNTVHSLVNSNVETTVYTGTIPANTLTNGGTLVFKALFTCINSANTKTFRVKINGTDVGSYGTSAAVSFLGTWHLFLRSGNTQISQSPASSSSNAFTTSTVGTKSDYNFNYTSDWTVTVSIAMASSSETSALQSFSCVWEK